MKKLMLVVALAALSGCGTFERADPSARSARAAYTFGNIQADNGSTVNVTIGDGAMAAADGDGSVSQPTTTTTSVPTTFQTPVAMDPVSMGISAIATLAGKGIDAYTARQNATAATGAAATAKPECTGGACTPSAQCPDGACTPGGGCAGGACSD